MGLVNLLSAGRRVALLVVVGACLMLNPGYAQVSAPVAKRATEAGPRWQSLTPQQRSALAPLQGEWGSIDADRKAKWLEIAGRFPRLPADEQQRLQGRMAEWSRLSPSERGRARLNFQEAKQLPPQDRQAQWQAYQALPEDERRALATRATPAAPAPRLAPSGPPVPGEPPAKHNIIGNPSLTAAPGRPVAPTVVQAAPGATTTLVTRQPAPPAHQQTGMPKIAATPGFVDRTTMLPKRGPQGAATRAAGASQPKNP